MRKWIVDSGDASHPYKLVASWSVPTHAYCEAPDHFTRAMEPFIILGQDSEGEIVPVLSDKYFEEIGLKNEEKIQIKALERAQLLLAMKKAEQKREFNSLPFYKRLLRSLLKEKKK